MIIKNASFTMKYSEGESAGGGDIVFPRYGMFQDIAGYPKYRDRQGSMSDRIPCQVVPIEEDNVSYSSASGKTVVNARYMILVEARHLKERISKYNRIYNMSISILMDGGNNYPIRTTGVSIEYLRAVNQYKILCR